LTECRDALVDAVAQLGAGARLYGAVGCGGRGRRLADVRPSCGHHAPRSPCSDGSGWHRASTRGEKDTSSSSSGRWGGDPKTFTRVRTDVDAGALPADPQLHDVASAYASHRLANPGPAWTGPPWLAFAIPLGYFVIAAVNTAMSAGYVVLGLAWLLLATMGYRRTHVLPPRRNLSRWLRPVGVKPLVSLPPVVG